MAPTTELTVETFENATQEQIDSLRKSFHERIASGNQDFCPEDLARVKTDDLWMKRFLAAQEYDVKLATQMLYETCQWRKEFGTNDLDHTKLLENVLEKGILFIRNKDKWGKKLLIFKAKYHSKGVHNLEDVKKFIVYYFERIEREAKSEQISVIFDMKDTGWNNMDMDFIRYLITLLKSYYPFFVNFLMIFEMPWLLKSAWNIIKGWLPAKFVDRVKFIDKKTIGEFIDEDNQLVDWGGKDDYKYKFIPEIRAKPEMKRQGSANTDHLSSPVISNGKPPPDVKPRKVKFTGEDGGLNRTGVNVTSIDTGGDHRRTTTTAATQSIPGDRMSPIPPRQNVEIHGGHLAQVDETVTFNTTTDGIQGSFYVQNLNLGNIIVKVKTTSPDKYRVRPTIGIIEGECRTLITIHVYDGVPLWSVPQDRFQVQISLVPHELQYDHNTKNTDTDSIGSGSHGGINFGDLQAQWKNITDRRDAQVETHRLTCKIDPQLSPPGVSSSNNARHVGVVVPGMVTMNEDDMRRGLSQLEQKVDTLTSTITDKMNEKLKYIEYLLYTTIFMVVFVGIILYFCIPSQIKIPVDYHLKEIPSGGVVDNSNNIPLDVCTTTCIEN